MDVIRDNIRFLRKQSGMTQQEFADMLGIKRASLGAYEEGRATPNFECLKALSKSYDVSLDNLLTTDLSEDGKKKKWKPKVMDAGDRRILSITVDHEGKEFIQLVSEKAAAGYLSGYGDPDFVERLPRFQLPFLPAGTYRAFEIIGDSMLPIQPGSIVIAEYISNWKDITDGLTYIIMSKQNGIVFKRVFNQVQTTQSLLLRSDNISYSPYALNIEDVLEIWKARLYITKPSTSPHPDMETIFTMMSQIKSDVDSVKKAVE